MADTLIREGAPTTNFAQMPVPQHWVPTNEAGTTGDYEKIKGGRGAISMGDLSQFATPLTTAALGADASYTQTGVDRFGTWLVEKVRMLVWANQAGTLYLEHAEDNATWTTVASVAVSASTTTEIDWAAVTKRHFRARYVNGATAQTSFVLYQQVSGAGQTDVNVTGSIPAGTNNIGDVDVLSIAAGDNNIGNVDVLTLPALPAGTNNIGDVDVLTLPSVTVDKITGISSTTISADNAAATITLAAPAAGVAHYVWGIIVGFVGGAATKLCTVKDGATVKENLPVVNSLTTERAKPLKITDATALEVSLAASGTAGIIGYVTVMYETR